VGIVPQTTILTISVTATTTIGKPLPPESLKQALKGCEAILELNDYKIKLYSYIESRMLFIAPNLSAIVGPEIAARLVAIAGGLTELAKIPACNLQVLGVRKKGHSAFSKAGQELHMGLLAATGLVASVPPDLRQRAMKVVAGKCALAARIDEHGADPTGDNGKRMLADIQKKLEKWQEPPPAKKHKALVAPLQEYKKKRGGKRARREKDRKRQSEIAKAKNKMVFGKPELTDEYTGEGLGMIGQSGTGQLRVKKKEKQKGGALSRKMQARLKRVKSASSGTSGIASSVAFESVTGIELVNPELKKPQKPQRSKDKYFALNGEFYQVGKKRKLEEEDSKPPVPKF
jgi:U4/U6 small nuclear ribonucleoprotein PRP31